MRSKGVPILTYGDFRALLDHLDDNESTSIEPLAAWYQAQPVTPSEIASADLGCRMPAKDEIAHAIAIAIVAEQSRDEA